MSCWTCPICNEELGELNGYCEYCKVLSNTIVYNPNPYFVRDIRILHISDKDFKPLTPQEELFAKLFNHEKALVKDMDTLTLRAHREELSKIAFEAKARITAVDDEEKTRKKGSDSKPTGFARSVNTDENTSAAINTIKERQKRLSGKEKMLQNLIDMYVAGGMSRAEAEKTASGSMGAGKILETLKKKEESGIPATDRSEQIIKGETLHSPLGQENGFVIMKPKDHTQTETATQTSDKPKPVFNPFAK